MLSQETGSILGAAGKEWGVRGGGVAQLPALSVRPQIAIKGGWEEGARVVHSAQLLPGGGGVRLYKGSPNDDGVTSLLKFTHT
jgi:hypothetical protein